MFRMVNEWGNVYKEVKTEREKEELEKLGYKEVTEEIPIDKMKVDQLKKFAEENGIDLTGCSNKTEMIEAIYKALAEKE